MSVSTTDTLPQQTLYIRNLYEKLPKEELRKSMYAMFSQFGKILDVVVMKTYRLRGQAWVVFADIASATNARNSMQGFPFYDKPIRLEYAKTKSDAVAKIDKTFKPETKAQRQKRNQAAREAIQEKAKTQQPGQPKLHPVAPGEVAAGGGLPNSILFVQNLPVDATPPMINMLFSQFVGFKEVRLVDGRPGIAFVEYENDGQATQAMSGLQGFKIVPTHAVSISYAKQ